jgi:hypothetical protein
MKSDHTKTLTFGDLIAFAYRTCSRRTAKALVRFAVNKQVVVFRGRQRFVVS